MQSAHERHLSDIILPQRFDLPAKIAPQMVRYYCHSNPSRRLMQAAHGKSECEKEGNFSHLARKRSRFSGGENSIRACRATLGAHAPRVLAMAFPPSRTFLYLEHCGEAPQ